MPTNLFITGTDTNIGKTYISTGLLRTFNALGYSTLGIKPIATDCIRIKDTFYNKDALSLQKASSVKLEYDQINPFRFKPPIAPHIAAAQANTSLSVDALHHKVRYALDYPCDIRIIEGVGGWHVPLNNTETMADFVTRSNLSVVLVVRMRLGCLNHAILTYEAIKSKNVSLAGWIANYCEPHHTDFSEVISSLKIWLKIPLLGIINFNTQPEDIFHKSLLHHLRIA